MTPQEIERERALKGRLPRMIRNAILRLGGNATPDCIGRVCFPESFAWVLACIEREEQSGSIHRDGRRYRLGPRPAENTAPELTLRSPDPSFAQPKLELEV